MVALEALCHGILRRHPIPPHRVLGHSDVSPGRKIDPGHLFDWQRLAGAGIGLWPDAPSSDSLSGGAVVAALATIGYLTDGNDPTAPANRAALAAFRRHWCPETLKFDANRAVSGSLKAVADAVKKT